LWQAAAGRTPDGVTAFALNPPHTTAELLQRLVWPRSYPDTVDVVVELLMLITRYTSALLVPAVATAASAGRVDILVVAPCG